jgi:hypothetical protein
MSESEQDLFTELIATYRDLNKRVRGLPEERLTMSAGQGKSVRHVISQLRDSEMHFSQSLKDAVSGAPMTEAYAYGEAPVIGTESESDTTPIILSQFGTARESTLAILRGLTPEDWDRTVDNGSSIRTRVAERVSRDKRSMSDIVGLLGSP